MMTSALAQLLGFLEVDPQNLPLLSEAAEMALTENQPRLALDLLQRHERLKALAPKEMNLLGLVHLRLGDFSNAEAIFARLGAENPGDAGLRFNRAWCRTMTRDNDAALALLDEATVSSLPQAAALQVELQHDSGLFDEAWENAKRHVARFPDHAGLLAVASVLALDMDDPRFARDAALRAGNQPRALATLGLLALADARNVEAQQLFNRALEKDPQSPRAWLGKGLAELSSGSHADGATHIRHGAELFKEHVGSWIAAGWAYLLTNNLAEARVCFDKAYALDHNFAEAVGSLAVLSVFEGDAANARRLAETALRLDRNSYSAAFAQMLLLTAQGDKERARALFERALHQPFDQSGQTLAQALAKLGLSIP